MKRVLYGSLVALGLSAGVHVAIPCSILYAISSCLSFLLRVLFSSRVSIRTFGGVSLGNLKFLNVFRNSIYWNVFSIYKKVIRWWFILNRSTWREQSKQIIRKKLSHFVIRWWFILNRSTWREQSKQIIRKKLSHFVCFFGKIIIICLKNINIIRTTWKSNPKITNYPKLCLSLFSFNFWVHPKTARGHNGAKS
uniref:Candidate secreted effector n=1 Tax=Meloidogyne incognita TaxID=6306 RepID=A0A914N0V2_MELIC